MTRMADSVGAMMRELAESMKAFRDEQAPIFPPREEATGQLVSVEAELMAKYRDKPVKLSAKALGKPVEGIRPLRPGSKWGLPE